MIMQIALGIMFGFIFLAMAAALIVCIIAFVNILWKKRETILNMKEKYDFDEEESDDYFSEDDEVFDVKNWFEEEK